MRRVDGSSQLECEPQLKTGHLRTSCKILKISFTRYRGEWVWLLYFLSGKLVVPLGSLGVLVRMREVLEKWVGVRVRLILITLCYGIYAFHAS